MNKKIILFAVISLVVGIAIGFAVGYIVSDNSDNVAGTITPSNTKSSSTITDAEEEAYKRLTDAVDKKMDIWLSENPDAEQNEISRKLAEIFYSEYDNLSDADRELVDSLMNKFAFEAEG